MELTLEHWFTAGVTDDIIMLCSVVAWTLGTVHTIMLLDSMGIQQHAHFEFMKTLLLAILTVSLTVV